MRNRFSSIIEKIPLNLHLQYQKRAVAILVMTVMLWINTLKTKKKAFFAKLLFLPNQEQLLAATATLISN